MKSRKSEQICPGDTAGSRKWGKKFTNRKERRRAKIDPENAQRKHRYYGYSK